MELSVEWLLAMGYIHPMVMVMAMAMMSMYVHIQSNQPSCVYIIMQMKNNYYRDPTIILRASKSLFNKLKVIAWRVISFD
jgi:hypothetical protein